MEQQLSLAPDANTARLGSKEAGVQLQNLFGFNDFRPGQREAVDAALSERDALIVMPTGAGKSLCYQLPALMRQDLTLVVSPLVSLMQDQVEALEKVAPGQVASVNSQRETSANRAAIAQVVGGNLRMLYVAPERFASRDFLEQIRNAQIGLFVVDEAHCVSQWGHDFRPDYFRLADAARWVGARAIIATTATATMQVGADIIARLGLRDPVRVSTGFNRPNLSFSIVSCRNKDVAHAGISAALARTDALPAIVYAGTRSEAQRLADQLQRDLGTNVAPYHAGLARTVRANTQRRFMDGEVAVVVATNAFGMGVDKADVRTVCHESVPTSLEAYYQEAGRAGRDGQGAHCVLFACATDKRLHHFFIERSTVQDAALMRAAQRLLSRASDGRYELGIDELTETTGCDNDQVRAIIGHLARAGLIQPTPGTPDGLTGRIVGVWDGRSAALSRASAKEATRARWRHYRAVWAWVEGAKCRRAGILAHFGDHTAAVTHVDCCDVCVPSLTSGLTKTIVPVAHRRTPRRAPTAVSEELTGNVRNQLDCAIREVVSTAQPPVGRTRAVEVLRGGRSKVVLKTGYDSLPHYGAFATLTAATVLARIDELINDGVLCSTGGRFPKLALGESV